MSNERQLPEGLLEDIAEDIKGLSPGETLHIEVTYQQLSSEETEAPKAGSVEAFDYEKEAARTDLDHYGYLDKAGEFYLGPNMEFLQPGTVNPAFKLLHAVLGIMSEAGELADQLKRHIIYGQPLDRVNVIEELGDIEWYQALGARAVDSSLEECRRVNIAKLRKRYPEKFTAEQAVDRDTAAEREVLESLFDEEETRG